MNIIICEMMQGDVGREIADADVLRRELKSSVFSKFSSFNYNKEHASSVETTLIALSSKSLEFLVTK